MTEQERVAAALERLRIFPLPRTVLLPRAVMPLHVFEARYRAMVADALQGDRVLAVATLAPGWERDYEGRPAIYPVACAGLIMQDEKLPDGRYNLLLLGVQRVRILAEHAPARPWREVRAAPIVDSAASDLTDRANALRQMVLQLCTLRPGPATAALVEVAAAARDAGALADVVAAAILSEPEARLQLLGQADAGQRLDYVANHVAVLLGGLKGQPNPVSGKRALPN